MQKPPGATSLIGTKVTFHIYNTPILVFETEWLQGKHTVPEQVLVQAPQVQLA